MTEMSFGVAASVLWNLHRGGSGSAEDICPPTSDRCHLALAAPPSGHPFPSRRPEDGCRMIFWHPSFGLGLVAQLVRARA